MNFLFSCPVCDTPLEATPADTGQATTCPICGQGFPIPAYDTRTGEVLFDTAKTPPRPKESMAYLHAYASDGKLAPQVVRDKAGTVQIRCARCGERNPPQANWCAGCRMPFAVESGGMPGTASGTAPGGRGTNWFPIVFGVILAVLLLRALFAG